MPEPSTANNAFAITKSDTVVHPRFRALYVGTAGTVIIRTFAGNSITFTGVLAGSILPVGGDMVGNSSTAGAFVGLTY